MANDDRMFAGLRGNNQRAVISATTNNTRTNRFAQPNSISLSAGNLIVGSNNDSRQHGNQNRNPISGAGPKNFLNGNHTTSSPIDLPNGGANTRKNKTHQLDLLYHESRYSTEPVMLNLSEFLDIRSGDICELKTYHRHPKPSDRKIYFIAKDLDQGIKRRAKSCHISVLSGQLQSLLDLPSRSKVWVKRKEKADSEADLVELNIKDCLLNRGDMWCLSSQLVQSCLFSGQKLTFFDSIRATVNGIYRDGKKVLSGYVDEKTRVVFRSESARMIFLIQITDEMWNFEETGEQLFQKMVNSLFPKIFKKWKEIDTHHSITIAFSTSVDYSEVPFRELRPGELLKNTKDYFRIVVDQVHIIHWVEIMETLRKEFMNLTRNILNFKTEDGHSIIKGRFSPVIKSNILELVNFATTILADPFKQPDLRHTTTHVILISPGSGLYDVDYDLLKLTGKKLLSLEMTMDLICLSRTPLHVVPLLRYLDYENNLHHCSPNWLSIFFWNDAFKSSREWYPRCKIYDVQMMGLNENDILKEVDIANINAGKGVHSVSQLINIYDNGVFKSHRMKSLPSISRQGGLLPLGKNEQEINKISNTASAFVWTTPKVADAVIEKVQKPQVLANLYTTGTKGRSSGGSSTENTSSNDVRTQIPVTSLAVDTLKGINKKNSVKDFTHRIVNKLIPDWDQKRPASNSLRQVIEGPFEHPKVEVGSLSICNGASEQGPKITKNLSSLETENTQRSLTDNESCHASVNSLNSSRYSRGAEGRPFLLEEKKARNKGRIDIEGQPPIVDQTWIEIENPSIPVSGEIAKRMLPIRWKDVLPRYVAKKYSKWRSFTTPAELPITISEFPSKIDFDTNFVFRNHFVTLNIDQESYNQTCKDLLRNMIYLRLLTGFQLCVGPKAEAIELAKSGGSDESPIAKYTEGNWSSIKVYMMIDSEIHRLSCGVEGIIDVQRYIRKNEANPFEQVPRYIPLVKTRYENDYRNAEVDTLHVSRETFNWDQIDQVLAGYGDYGFNKKSYGFRSKLVVLPAEIPATTYSSVISGRNETLTAEEIRLEGLRRLIALVTRSPLRTVQETLANKSKKDEIQQEIQFYTGSLFDFIHEQQASLEKSVLHYKDSIFASENRQLKKDVELKTLANEIQHGSNPLALVTRKWHWKKHKNSFLGSEMVNWLIRNFGDIDTREDAVEYGQILMDRGMFVHVLNKHGFLDGHYFYQISPDFIFEVGALEKTHSDQKSTETRNFAKDIEPAISTSESNIVSNSSTYHSARLRDMDESRGEDQFDLPKPTVILSTSMVIDVDPAGKSYKLETCTVHYDKVHNPEHCFHIRLEWLTTTPKLLDDLVGNWSRLCERYGLRLVEVPWKELCQIPSINPFHSFVDIKLAINPWEDPEFKDLEILSAGKFYYHMYLLKASGFLFDNRASTFLEGGNGAHYNIVYSWGKPEFKYAQFIHSTGAYIAEIRENGNLFLAPNNIYISRVNHGNVIGKAQSSPQFALDAQKVMLDFKKTCTTYEELRTILLQAKEKWIEDQFYEDYLT